MSCTNAGMSEADMRRLNERVESVEDAQMTHEAVCAERYKNLEVYMADGKADRANLRQEVKSTNKLMLIALILIAFTAVFKEASIIELVRVGASVVTGQPASSSTSTRDVQTNN